MQLHKKLTLLFTRMKQAMAFVRPRSSTNTPQAGSLKLYKNCHTLPLQHFITCLCDEDLSVLCYEGNATEKDLQEAWFGIYTEFIDLSDNADMKAMYRLTSAITILKARLMVVDTCVQALYTMRFTYEQTPDKLKYFVDTLRSMNFRFKYDPTQPDAFIKDLEKAQSSAKIWQLHLEMKQDELAAYEAKQTGNKVDRIYFTKTLVALSEFYRFDENTVTVATFCAMKTAFYNRVKVKKNGKY